MHGSTEQKHLFHHSYTGVATPLPCHSATKHVFACHFAPHRVTFTHRLVSICPLQLLHDSLEYLEENSDTPLKRKSPYILKRQAAHTTKSRRPYILKRSTIYWQPSWRGRSDVLGDQTTCFLWRRDCVFFSLLVAAMFFIFPFVVFIQSDPSIVR